MELQLPAKLEKVRRFVSFVVPFLIVGCASANVLFDAAKGAPNSTKWGWFYLSLPPRAILSGPGNSGYVTLDTTAAMNIQAGFGKILSTKIDRVAGYSATWRLKVVEEKHSGDKQRAGLSVFVLGNDHRGVEVGYWNNRVFVYNDDKAFTPGEFAVVDTTAKMRTYHLVVKGDNYSISVDGTQQLSGKLRDYSWFGFPYNRANSLWYGDDSRRGQSVSQWAFFEIKQG